MTNYSLVKGLPKTDYGIWQTLFLLEVDMAKGWRVIDCTAMTGKLTYKRGQLVVEHHNMETRIPLADTAVLLLGMQTTVSTALLQQLAVF